MNNSVLRYVYVLIYIPYICADGHYCGENFMIFSHACALDFQRVSKPEFLEGQYLLRQLELLQVHRETPDAGESVNH